MNEKTARLYKERNEMKAEIEIVEKPKRNKAVREADKVLTLDEIEQKMVELAMCDTDDIMTMMINEKKIAMYEKVANLKMHRLQIQELERASAPVEIAPIEVKFIDSNNVDTNNRVAEMESKLEKQLGMGVPKS